METRGEGSPSWLVRASYGKRTNGDTRQRWGEKVDQHERRGYQVQEIGEKFRKDAQLTRGRPTVKGKGTKVKIGMHRHASIDETVLQNPNLCLRESK